MASPPQSLPLQSTLSSLPPVHPGDLRAQTRALLSSTASTIPLLVALDDDPTGTQTCHDIRVLTVWDVESLAAEFARTPPGSGFFILTNSRALHTADARALVAEICRNLRRAAAQAGGGGGDVPFEVVLRGDSTLRGHFPDEPEVVDEEVGGGGSDAWVLAPFFLQGGRYTIDDVHYVAEGDTLVPAGETPFARDATFGYRSSDLRDWVVEKSAGKIARERVVSLGLGDIRQGGPERIAQLVEGFEKGSVIVVNAAAEEDMDVVVLGLLKASSKGKRFLFRTAAAFVSARLGIPPIPSISAQQLQLSHEAGGLIIAGSYVPKTTAQLEVLTSKSGDKLTTVVLDVEKLLASPESSAETIAHAITVAEREIARRQDVLVMTSRKLVVGEDAKKSLDIGSIVADALVKFLQQLKIKPRYVIAKGGITSSDMATKGLNMKKAMIVGQAAAGIPLWRCDEETCKYPGLPYVVFPGNVGGNDTLYEVVNGWRV
ncbi:putative oxidoreductase ygbj protein [Diplodia corticola]|uniref:Putative oxidoreductase ygbj protein n=1 Tax=Diplodia corticola TaxID=236234 RepID=A0A1J9RPE5_9PEZI|nr:putative oxidoreductase ygbj protein [Diplodia corticola]OJD34427.1 putative oxidoreductase ygbj protein [Diplodia corticola]